MTTLDTLRALLPAGKLEAVERAYQKASYTDECGTPIATKAYADDFIDELAAGWAEALTVRQCGAENPHKLIPSRCPFCGEDLIPACCLDLAQDCYRDGKKQSESDLAAVTAERDRWEWVARELSDRGASCGFTLDDAFVEYAARYAAQKEAEDA